MEEARASVASRRPGRDVVVAHADQVGPPERAADGPRRRVARPARPARQLAQEPLPADARRSAPAGITAAQRVGDLAGDRHERPAARAASHDAGMAGIASGTPDRVADLDPARRASPGCRRRAPRRGRDQRCRRRPRAAGRARARRRAASSTPMSAAVRSPSRAVVSAAYVDAAAEPPAARIVGRRGRGWPSRRGRPRCRGARHRLLLDRRR